MDYMIWGTALIIGTFLFWLAYRLNVNVKHSGETLVLIRSFDTVVFRPIGIMIGLGGVVNVVLNPSWTALFFAILTASASVYSLMIVKASKHALGQNGIVIVEGFSKLIPWDHVVKMNLHNQRLFIETGKRFYSIRVYNENMAEIESLLRTKHYIQP